MQPILDSFDNNSPSKWIGKIERQGVLIVITLLLFVMNTIFVAILGQPNDPEIIIMVVLFYLIGNITFLLLGYFSFILIVTFLKKILILVKLAFLISPFNLNMITFAFFLNSIIFYYLLSWILSIP